MFETPKRMFAQCSSSRTIFGCCFNACRWSTRNGDREKRKTHTHQRARTEEKKCFPHFACLFAPFHLSYTLSHSMHIPPHSFAFVRIRNSAYVFNGTKKITKQPPNIESIGIAIERRPSRSWVASRALHRREKLSTVTFHFRQMFIYDIFQLNASQR